MYKKNEDNLYEKMAKIYPDKDPIFTAVSNLKTNKEINDFLNDCIEYYQWHGNSNEIREKAKHIVKKNIEYIVGYYDKKIANKWYAVIDGQ